MGKSKEKDTDKILGMNRVMFFIIVILLCILSLSIGIYAQIFYRYSDTDPFMLGIGVGKTQDAAEITELKNNFNNDIIEKKTFSKGLVNYKRIFIRNLVLEASGKKNVYGNTVLTEPDYSAYGTKHNLSLVCSQSLKQSCDSDEELEEALDGKLIIGDKHYSVDDYIKILSSLFYNKYLNSKKNMGAHK